MSLDTLHPDALLLVAKAVGHGGIYLLSVMRRLSRPCNEAARMVMLSCLGQSFVGRYFGSLSASLQRTVLWKLCALLTYNSTNVNVYFGTRDLHQQSDKIR